MTIEEIRQQVIKENPHLVVDFLNREISTAHDKLVAVEEKLDTVTNALEAEVRQAQSEFDSLVSQRDELTGNHPSQEEQPAE